LTFTPKGNGGAVRAALASVPSPGRDGRRRGVGVHRGRARVAPRPAQKRLLAAAGVLVLVAAAYLASYLVRFLGALDAA
jgi:hypothetical protein